MDVLFGDATKAMPTPATQAERASILGVGSPASIDIRRGGPRPSGRYDADDAIPGLDIDPPDMNVDANGSVVESSRGRRVGTGEAIGGWIGRIMSRTRGRETSSSSSRGGNNNNANNSNNSNRGQYGRIQQSDD